MTTLRNLRGGMRDRGRATLQRPRQRAKNDSGFSPCGRLPRERDTHLGTPNPPRCTSSRLNPRIHHKSKKAAPFRGRLEVKSTTQLERQPRLYLQLPSGHCRSDERTVRAGRRNHCGADRSELTAADVRDGVREVRVVEYVVSIRTQTQADALRKRDILQEGEVGVEVVGTTEGIPRNVAEVGLV